MAVRQFRLALPVVLGCALSVFVETTGCAKPVPAKASAKGSATGSATAGNLTADAALARGKLLFQQKQYKQAVTVLTAALAKNDSLKQAYLVRGDCEQALKQYSDAAADFGQYAVLAPNDVGVYLRLSKVYGSLNKNNLALSYLSKAVVLSPRDANLYVARAALYDKLGNHAMAADDRTVATALAKARSQPGKGVVVTVAPAPKKASDAAVGERGSAGQTVDATTANASAAANRAKDSGSTSGAAKTSGTSSQLQTQ